MITASMLDLARTGRLGPLQCGLSKADLVTFLGDPPNWSVKKDSDSSLQAAIWRYGDVEFHFQDRARNVLWMIFTDHDNLTDGGDTLRLDPWAVRKAIPLAEFEMELVRAGVQYAVQQPKALPEQRLVVTSANVTFAFLQEPRQGESSGLFAWSIREGPPE